MRQLWRDLGRDTRLMMLSYLLWGIAEGLWMVLLPLYLKFLGATPGQGGFVIGLWGAGRLFVILPAGWLGDRIGARRVMLPGWYAGLIGVVGLALAPDWRWTIPAMLMYGVSASVIPVTNLYMVQAGQHDPTRLPTLPVSTSLTLLWASYTAGVVLTPSLGGWLGDHLGLRAVYGISTFWLLLSTLAVMSAHHYPVSELPAHGYAPQRILRQPGVLVALGLLTLGFTALLIGQPLASQYLEEVRGFSRTTIGIFGSLTALGTTIFSVLLGRLRPWVGLYISLSVAGISFLFFIASGALPFVALTVFLLGAHYAARPLASAIISPLVEEHQRGMAFALVEMLVGLAATGGPTAAGFLYARDPHNPFVVGALGVALTLMLGVPVLRGEHRANRNAAFSGAYREAERAS